MSHKSSNSLSSFSCRSSYSSGTASIIVSQQTSNNKIETPPRTTSLNVKQFISQSPPSSLLSLFEDEFEDIDLIADNGSLTSCESREELTMDNMSNVIATALELASTGGKNLSSLSTGKASIIRSKSIDDHKKKSNRLSKRFFSWSGSSKSQKSTSVVSSQPFILPPRYDDGKAELIFRGVRVKEIESTLDPIVLSSKMNIYSNNNSLVYKPVFDGINY
jgi:hypothetical protein